MTVDLLARLAGALEKTRQDSGEGVLRCEARDEALVAACLEEALPLAGVQAVVVTPGAPACTGPLHELPRRAARAGAGVERLYLLPEPALAADDSLSRHVALDREAGIGVTLLDIAANIAADESALAPLLDCALWQGGDGDGLLLSGSHATGWTLSGRAQDIAARRALIEEVRLTAAPIALEAEGASHPAGPREPLLTSAPLAKQAAPALCRRSVEDDCSWYHGYWQYLRLLGVVAAPERHAEFYARALGGLAASRDYRRILISANADYAMLAHLLHAYGGDSDNIDITVLDICETPLMLCKWYAMRHGLRIETEACDILQWRTERRFDLVVTHSFLPMLPAPARQALVAKWSEVLRPGGKVVSTTRINPDWSEARIMPGPERVRAFRDNAMREALKWQSIVGIDADILAAAAEDYMRRLSIYSLTSEDELRDLLTASGFAFDALDMVMVEGKVGQRQAGPGTSQSASYAEFIATRE